LREVIYSLFECAAKLIYKTNSYMKKIARVWSKWNYERGHLIKSYLSG